MRRVFGPRKSDPVGFWSTWYGATIASLGILLLVAFVWFGGDVEVRLQTEMDEVRTALVAGDFLRRHFELVVAIDPVPHTHQRYRALTEAILGHRERTWSVVRNETGVRGHFTFEISGWRNILDKRRAPREQIVVFFEKKAGGSITIKKIDGIFIHYPPRRTSLGTGE